MLHEQIKNNIKEAMLSKNAVLLKTLRNMVAAFMNEVITKGRKPSEMLSDEETLVVIKRMIKKGNKAIELFKQGNRQDLVDQEEKEIKILESFLK